MRHIMIKTAALGLAATIMLSGCGGINKEATLVNIDKGKDKITLGYGNFVARYTQASYDPMYRSYFGDEYWTSDMYGDGKTMQTTVKKEVMDNMEDNYLAKKHADEYKVEITDKEQKNIDKAAKDFMKSNEQDAIDQMGATEEYAKDMLEYETYGIEVKNKLKDEAKVNIKKDEYEEATISYASFSMTDDDSETSEVDKDKKKQAKASAEAVSKATDFDKEVQAQGGTVDTASYVIKGDSSKEDLDKTVIDAAKKLKKGQISDVIEVKDDAYYVIRKDLNYDKEASATKKQELEDEARQKYCDDKFKDWKKDISWEVDKKAWAKVKFDSLFEKPKEETESTEETTGTETTGESTGTDAAEETTN